MKVFCLHHLSSFYPLELAPYSFYGMVVVVSKGQSLRHS